MVSGCFTLPKGEENDGLDGAELQDRIEWPQEVSGGVVEHVEGVQRKTDGDVVDESDVEVSLAAVPVAVFVGALGLQPDRHNRHHGLHHAELRQKRKKRNDGI